MSGCRRLLLGVSYDGTDFAGFQRQADHRTVQATLEEAILRLCGEPSRVVGAGRTDAGVHARGQIVHVDVQKGPPVERWPKAMNRYLPDDVAIWGSREIPSSVHAQRSATAKTYRYSWHYGSLRCPLSRRTHALLIGALDIEAMKSAVTLLQPGIYDFRMFQSTGSRIRTTKRQIVSAKLREQKSSLMLEITANGFLYHMVPRIAGAIVEIGRGRFTVDDFATLLEGKPVFPPPTAPAHGLCLERVYYDGNIDLVPPDC